MRYLGLVAAMFFLVQCGRVQRLSAGKYQVADQEYSSQNYNMQRVFADGGALEERHELDRCLLIEMTGRWEQAGGTLKLSYARLRNRATCHDSLPDWAADSTRLTIPIRNVDGVSFESLLAASGGRPEKWIKWVKLD